MYTFKLFCVLATAAALQIVDAEKYNDKVYYDEQQNEIQHHAKKGENILLDINFAHEFYKFDPRSESSAFFFGQIYTATDLRTDNAAFLHRTGTDLVDMVSLPFNHWLPQNATGDAEALQQPLSEYQRRRDNVSPQLTAYDASAILKQPVPIAPGQVLKFAYRFTCQTLNTQEVAKRFPHEAILNYKDDPRLASCAIAISDQLDTGVEFAIYATSHGVWAKYSVNAQARYQTNGAYDAFDIARRIGSRAHVDEIIDARIEIDRGHRKEARYYLNDQLVWRVGNLGLLSEHLLMDRSHHAVNRLVTYSPGHRPRVVPADPSSYILYITNCHRMDEADPNRRDDDHDGKQYSPALIRLVGASVPHLYGGDIWFYDEHSERYNSLAGQGAVAGMQRLLVTMCDAQQQKHKLEYEVDHDEKQAADWYN